MLKTYTTSTNTTQENVITPKQTVLDSILNFSKSLEIIPVSGLNNEETTNIELTLN